MPPVLWSLVYSPWSERARWALDACGVDYRKRSYRPLIDEPALRLALRRWRGPVSVPILVTDDGVINDSFAIAEYASEHALPGRSVMPLRLRADIARINELASEAMAAGRVLGLRRIVDSEQALADMVPGALRPWLGRLGVPIAAAGIRRTLSKYASVTPDQPRGALREALEALRAELGGESFLLGEFSYADITAAQVLAFVEPPTGGHLRLTDATRAAYRDAELSDAFADLVGWRDALYRSRRSTPA